MAASGALVARVAVAIDGDLTGYNAAMAQAEQQAPSRGEKIKAAMSSGNFGMLAQDLVTPLGQGVSLTQALGGYARDLGSDLKSLSVNALNSGLNTIKSTIGSIASGAKSLVSDLGQGFAMGLGLGAFQSLSMDIGKVIQAIPNLINQGKDWIDTVHTIQAATGGTAEQVSTLAGALTYLGESTSNLSTVFAMMANSLPTVSAKLNALGIATTDQNGASLNLITILDNMRQRFSQTGESATQLSDIYDTLRRAGVGKLIDYLQMTDAQWAKLTADLQAGGLVIQQSQIDLGVAFQREWNRIGNVMTGLGVKLLTDVGPTIEAWVSTLATDLEAHTTDIANAISNVIGWIMGMISAISGIPTNGLAAFSADMNNASPPVSALQTQIDTLNGQISALDASSAAAKESTKDLTGAISDQETAVTAQIAAVKALDTAQQQAFDGENARLASQITAQISQIDAAQKQLAATRQQEADTRELADDQQKLSDAQIKLQEELAKVTIANPNTDSIRSAQQAVVAAEQTIADKRQSMADQQLTDQQDNQKAQLQATQTYITDLDKLVGQSTTNRAALEKTLGERQRAVQAELLTAQKANDTLSISDAQAKLAAIADAEKRNSQALANAKKTDALTALKDQLAAEKSAISAAASDTTAIQRAALVQQRDDLQKALDDETKSNANAQRVMQNDMRATAGEVSTGVGGAFLSALADGKTFGAGIHDMLVGTDGKGGLLQNVTDFSGALQGVESILNSISSLTKGIPWQTVAGAAAGGQVGGIPGAIVGGVIGTALGANSEQQIIDMIKAGKSDQDIASYFAPGPAWGAFIKLIDAERAKLLSTETTGGHAAGGLIGRNGPETAVFGERGPEYVLSNETLRALDRLNSPSFAFGGAASLQPAIIRLEIGGRKLLDYVDENLALRHAVARRT